MIAREHKDKMNLKVCMFVYNNFTHDTRVLKEAKALTEAGYEVTVIALLDQIDIPYENQNGIKIIRVVKDPINFRLLRWMKEFDFSQFFETLNKTKKNNKKLGLKQKIRKIISNFRQDFNYIEEIGIKNYYGKKLQGSSFQFKSIFFSIIIIIIYILYRVITLIDYWFIPKILSVRGFKQLLQSKTYSFNKSFKQKYKKIINNIQKWFKVFWYRYLYITVRNFLSSFHRPLCFLDYHYRSLTVVDQHRADIYHAHDLNVLGAAYHCARKYGGKIVYDSHEFYVERNRGYKLNPLRKFALMQFEKILIRRSNAVITVSESIAEELAKRYQVSVPTVILNVPISPKQVIIKSEKSIRVALEIQPEYKILLYTGGIAFNRGLDKIIKSLQFLPQCYFVMMGKGPEKYINQLKEIALENGVDSRVCTFGPVPSGEVTTYAASADLGIAAIENVCLSYYYCAPNKIFEYLSANLPIIASDFPEMSRIINQHEIGGTFDPTQPQDIARAAQDVFNNPEKMEKMRENTKTAAQFYNWEVESKKFLSLYETLSS
jgi:glycosyltransferase involved in cell wall biosynthesis